ncbi:protein-L-isoaspartate O-methyltransferase family protein [Tistrella mobilis]|jgi:protein-L-isoaspartate(D-aspartate) O-methyltransferase
MAEDIPVRQHQDALFRQIEAYVPIRGRPIPIRLPLKEAFYRFPRHAFVNGYRRPGISWGEPVMSGDPGFLAGAYENRPLMYVDESGRTLEASSSEPAFIFHLAELLDVRPGQRVLEIGCGTGWLVALLSHLVGPEGHVTGVEINPHLHAQAARNLSAQSVTNATVLAGDGFGVCKNQSFDRLIMTASAFHLPHRLLTILESGGKAVIPIRNRGLAEEAHLLERVDDRLEARVTRLCKFVPMTGSSATGASVIHIDDDPVLNRLRSVTLSRTEMTFGQDNPGDMLRHALPLTACLSKTTPTFRAYALGPYGRGGLDIAVFGDPDSYGFGLADEARGSAAVWHKGIVSAYGTPHCASDLAEKVQRWIEAGRPSGFAFGLTITAGDAAPPEDHMTGVYREDRGDLAFWWYIRPPEQRI